MILMNPLRTYPFFFIEYSIFIENPKIEMFLEKLIWARVRADFWTGRACAPTARLGARARISCDTVIAIHGQTCPLWERTSAAHLVRDAPPEPHHRAGAEAPQGQASDLRARARPDMDHGEEVPCARPEEVLDGGRNAGQHPFIVEQGDADALHER